MKDIVQQTDIDIDICPSKKGLFIQKIKEEREQYLDNNLRDIFKKNLGCTLIATFGSETTKSVILNSCRGYRSKDYPKGIDVDDAQYISSLIEKERGFLYSLEDTVYGNPEKDRKPNKTFLKEVAKYPGLLDTMFTIQGLYNKRSSHASGVVMFENDPFDFCCFMKTPSGDVITQYDLHDVEYCGGVKVDILVTDAQDEISETLRLLQKDNLIKQESLKNAYEDYLHPEKINLDEEEVWKKIKKNDILRLFQFDSPVGGSAIKKIQPDSIIELASANGLLRLMNTDKSQETAMDKYVRFKKNLDYWYLEMDSYGLTENEQKIFEKYMLQYHGVCFSQEQLMLIVMNERICGYSLAEANRLRKTIGKKQMNKIPFEKDEIFTRARNENLARYIWDCCVGPQLG